MKINYFRFTYRLLFVLGFLYLLYLIKSALGINISEKYHAADIFKLPIKIVTQKIVSH
uniref:Uncharacterized protein n=1 Tax=Gloeothece verrucosa (strain PCC 7822) TaxID=497965 RepID=E0UJY2_GLOV7|nr:hypothetical protein Cyan7822_2650 [Gloeothece verrucosa PCC 7822]